MINKIGLIMGIIGLISSVIWGVMYYNNKRRTEALLEEGTKTLAVLEKTAKLREDSITLEIKRRDSTINNLSLSQRETKEALNKAVSQGKILASDLRKAKAQKDTPTYYAKCDSLAENLAIVEAENTAYQDKVDSLNLNYQRQLGSKDSLLKSKDELYSKLRESFAGSVLTIDNLKTENKKLSVKLERSKRTSRTIALLGIVAAGTIYVTTR